MKSARESVHSAGPHAALEAEYTLPGVSQSVVITRMAGRTPVPEERVHQELRRTPCNHGHIPEHGNACGTGKRTAGGGDMRRIHRQLLCIRPPGRNRKSCRCTVDTLG